MADTPLWKICIVTTEDDEDYRSVKNSVLYSDHTHWISLEVVYEYCRRLSDVGGKAIKARETNQPFRAHVRFREPASYRGFRDELRKGGATQLVTEHFDRIQTEDYLLRMFSKIQSETTPADNIFIDSLRQEIAEVITDCRVFVCQSETFAPRTPYWNAYTAAHELMMGVSRLLLPDVSNLPVEAIMEVRRRLQDSLDPLRAEMLRLTDDLREIIGTERGRYVMAAEVDNLIATRIEPVVRDANRRANELLERKWRKLFTGAAKAFGFAGAGFLDSRMIAKAIQQTLETGALGLADVEDHSLTYKATSQFVLRARRLTANAESDN